MGTLLQGSFSGVFFYEAAVCLSVKTNSSFLAHLQRAEGFG